MRVFNNRFLFLLLVLLTFSCKNEKSDNVADDSDIRFRYYNLENQGWKSKKHSQIVDSINFTATEVPIQYYLLKSNPDQSLIKTDSIYDSNKREKIIEFTFQDEEERDLLGEKFTKMNYNDAVEYMSFTIQKDFSIVTSKNDTIQCSGVLFERNFKIAPFQRVLLFFSNIDPNDKIQLVYQDNLFKRGILKFRFKEPVLNL